jgi:Transcriptional regulator, AbiEi antitoxin, Type IV TA system
MITRGDLEREAQTTLSTLLRTVPEVRLETIHPLSQSVSDFEVCIVIGSQRQTLLCEVRSRAWPNELFGVGHRLKKEVEQRLPERAIPVVIAPFLSPQAIETCAEFGISWADLAGNCDLKLSGSYIRVRGNPNRFKQGRGTASLYSPQSSRVIQALLLEPLRKWTTEDLAKAASVSLGQVSNVRQLLKHNNWIRASYGATSLAAPRKLLDDWSLHYKPQRNALRFFSLDAPAVLEERIRTDLSEYAFTEFSAAEQYAPYTRHQRVALYVSRWSPEDASILGLKGGDGATNVTIYETGQEIAFIETVNGRCCASPIQTYLDLRLQSGRSQDAAQHLLETIILPRWK